LGRGQTNRDNDASGRPQENLTREAARQKIATGGSRNYVPFRDHPRPDHRSRNPPPTHLAARIRVSALTRRSLQHRLLLYVTHRLRRFCKGPSGYVEIGRLAVEAVGDLFAFPVESFHALPDIKLEDR
jgi:hypothetical protein